MLGGVSDDDAAADADDESPLGLGVTIRLPCSLTPKYPHPQRGMLYVSFASAAVHRRKGSWAMSALARAILQHAVTPNRWLAQWESQAFGAALRRDPRSRPPAQRAAPARSLVEVVVEAIGLRAAGEPALRSGRLGERRHRHQRVRLGDGSVVGMRRPRLRHLAEQTVHQMLDRAGPTDPAVGD